MRRKLEKFSQSYTLSSEDIERFSETLEEKLKLVDMEQQNRIRIRFSVEESLLRMRDRFGEKAEVTLTMRTRFGRPVLQIDQAGERYNPLSKTEVELEDWSGTLLTAVGLYPQYSYARGRNILRLNLPAHRMNPALKILIAVAVGTVLGLTLTALLSQGQQAALVSALLQPLYDLWIRILSVLSGPVIFLMVITTFLNFGGIEEEGGNSRRVTARYFAFSATVAVLAGLVACASSGNLSMVMQTADGTASGYLSRLFAIVPKDALSPLVEANTPQILLLAFLLGNGLVSLGSRVDGLTSLVRQGNMVGLLMAEWISRCVPYFAAALICYEIIWRQADMLRGLPMVLVPAVAVSLLCMLAVARHVSREKKIPLRLLLEKLRPAFVRAIRTGGLDEGFGEMQTSCIRQLGIERHYVEISLPMGMTLYMPVSGIGILVFTIYAAVYQNVALSASWLIVAVVLTVVMSAAAPPVPGASLLTYIMLFTELGIPEVALIAAMVFDILFGIFAAAGNQALLQLDLILQADQIGLLDKERLRK